MSILKNHFHSILTISAIVLNLAIAMDSMASNTGWARLITIIPASMCAWMLHNLRNSVKLDAARRARFYYEQTQTDEARDCWFQAVDKLDQ